MSVFCHCNAMFSIYVGLIPCICQRNVRGGVRTMFVCAQTKSRCDCLLVCLSRVSVCNAPMSVCSMPRSLSARRPCVFFSTPVCLSTQHPYDFQLNAHASVFSMPAGTVCLLNTRVDDNAPVSVLHNAYVPVCSMPVCLSAQCQYVCLSNAPESVCSMPVCLSA
jgi:hypothetical protein